MEKKVCDLLIIGGGPAGLTAAIYGSRAGLKTVVLEKQAVGGQIINTLAIENYPGFAEPIGGFELAQVIEKQAKGFGAKIELGEAKALRIKDNVKEVETKENIFEAKAVIIATGSSPQNLGVPGEEKLKGRGVSFCATCDGAFFKEKDVLVVGGGDSAIEEALFLTRFAKKVTVVHRRDELRAVKTLQRRAFANPKIEFIWESIVTEILGEARVEGVRVKNRTTGEEREVKVDGVFIYIGNTPNSSFVRDVLNLDERGYIITDEKLETSRKGVFAAGDVRSNLLKQVAVAVGEGALAAVSAFRYIEDTS